MQFWRGDQLLTWGYASTELLVEREKRDPRTGRPAGIQATRHFAQPGLRYAGFDAHTVVLQKRGESGVEVWVSALDGTAESQGEIAAGKSLKPLAIHPLDGQRLLLALPFGGAALPVQGKFSPLVVVKRREQGGWEPVEAVDLGLDLYDELRMKAGPKVPSSSVLKPGKGILWQDLLVPVLLRAGDFPVLYLPREGRLISLSPKDGSVRQSTLIFPSTQENEHAKRPKEVTLLGAAPTREGRLLLATRSEDAVLYARETFQDALRNKPKQPVGTFQSEVDQAAAAALEAYPDVLYWEWDPESGGLHRLPAPEGLPTKLRRFQDLAAFRLRATVDGGFLQDGTPDKVPARATQSQ